MNPRDELLDKLKQSVETWNVKLAVSSARQALELGIPPGEAIEKGLALGMLSISQRFDEATIFLPQVLAASRAMEAAMKVFEPAMGPPVVIGKGVIVLGTVQGDIHEIGKNVIGAMLRGAGYKVLDLGKDVMAREFVDTCRECKADLLAASALLTTTLVGQKEIAELLREEGLNTKTIFGGAPCTQKWVEGLGGDAYCANGAEVVAVVNELLKRKD